MILHARWWGLVFAAAGGFLIDLASPGVGWWPLAWLGIALILAALWGRGPAWGALLGAVAGAAFWLPHISWLTLYLGPIPWLALGVAMTLWWVALGTAIAALTRWLPLVRWRSQPLPAPVLATLLALGVAGLWVAREQGQSTLPYGGFAWGRIAHTQAESPLVSLVSWLGFAGLSGLMVFLVALPLAWYAGGGLRVRTAQIRWGIGAVAAGLVLVLIPSFALPPSGSLRVAAVQGNADAGIFADRQPGDIFQKHAEATLALAEEVGPDSGIDLVVWPENAADLNVRAEQYPQSVLDSLSKKLDAPILTGTILRDGEEYFNSALLWTPGEGFTERYDKKHPVPFAEYMPNRDFFHAIVPDLIDLVQLDYTAGTRPSAIDVGAGVLAGVAICFDIIFDDLAVDMIDSGAQIILAPTNNADFGRTDESAQQLAIARMRAVETGRTVVNISTVGTSAIVLPDGRSAEQLQPFTQDVIVADVPLVDGKTPAIAWGAAIAGGWMFLGLGLGGIAVSARLLLRFRGGSRGASASAENLKALG